MWILIFPLIPSNCRKKVKTAWTVYTNANFFLTKKKKIGKYTAKLTFLWNYNFGKKERSLHARIGMAAIPKISHTSHTC